MLADLRLVEDLYRRRSAPPVQSIWDTERSDSAGSWRSRCSFYLNATNDLANKTTDRRQDKTHLEHTQKP